MNHTKYTTTAILLSSLLLGVPAARAEDLQGDLSMGEAFHIKLESSEGTFKEFLRTIRVRSAPRKVIDLTEMGKSRDRLFVGNDWGLYVEKLTETGYQREQTFKVGKASKLWEMKLEDGVVLKEVATVTDAFTGGSRNTALKVETAAAPIIEEESQKADLKFFLGEVVFQYDSPRRGEVDNYTVILESLHDALPDSESDPQEKMDKLTELMEFIKDSNDGDLVVFREFLTKKVERAEVKAGNAEDKVVVELKKLKDEVFQRTEGF